MDRERIKYLFDSYMAGSSSEAERAELSFESLKPEHEGLIRELMENSWEHWQGTEATEPAKVQAMLENITKPGAVVHRVHFLRTAWFRYAAVLMLVAGTATYLYVSSLSSGRGSEVTKIRPVSKPQDVLPGGNKAILTLADGSTILLDSAANGNLATQNGIKIIKLDGGKLAYEGRSAGVEGLYNTISTPKGGQYQIVLPDGTRVWLNAASSINFPTAFLKTERRVKITGEVYFEVARETRRPFKVMTGDRIEVDVLGTSFNINAYTDENSISTTLTEGSVRVVLLSGENNSVADKIITPCQQGTIRSQAGKIIQEHIDIIRDVDMQKILAWKNGLFYFTEADLKTVMRQLSRWYDLDLHYAEGVRLNERITGEMKRDLNLNQVLEGLGELGVHFKLEGKRLTVMP